MSIENAAMVYAILFWPALVIFYRVLYPLNSTESTMVWVCAFLWPISSPLFAVGYGIRCFHRAMMRRLR